LATNGKDFKIKNGLIVQGATATVNGNDVITSASSVSDLADIDTSGASDSQALVYNAATNSWIPGAAIGGGGGSYTISATAPESPSAGDVWFDSTDGKSYIYYDDGDTTQWLEIGSRQPGPTGATGPAGANGINGVDGLDGEGVPAGGTTGQALVKASGSDYDTQWSDLSSAISDLSDTNILSPADGESLVYNGATGEWINADATVEVYGVDTAATDYFMIPVGGDAERPVTPANGHIRFNSDLGYPEWYSEGIQEWIKFKDVADADFTATYLVAAGGAGGGIGQFAGGGGAGGLIQGSNTLSTSVGYEVTVGAGGAGDLNVDGHGASGNNSVFFNQLSIGGGGGASTLTNFGTPNGGLSGGSGGGACAWTSGSASGGSGTPGQGNAGGGVSNPDHIGGGGGGAGAAGQSATGRVAGNGGVGILSAISGGALYYSGGGGGACYYQKAGDGGLGGGGGGGSQTSTDGISDTSRGATPVSGDNAGSGGPNTGGGGGANSQSATNGGNGGSGVIIIRYPSQRTLNADVGHIFSTIVSGSEKITTFTAGTGTVTFS
jgi:hypothetical protein